MTIPRALLSSCAALVLAGPVAGCAAAVRTAETGLAPWGYRADDDAAVSAALEKHGFSGQAGISRRGGSFHLLALGSPVEGTASDDWPWASVTKQVIATLVMQQVEKGAIELDVPATTYLSQLGNSPEAPTVRQLLQHQSGLPNPDDSAADASGWPSFYTSAGGKLEWCLDGRTAIPAEGWSYNNCDYILLGAMIEHRSGKPLSELIQSAIGEPAGWTGTRLLARDDKREYFGKTPQYSSRLAGYGAAAALVGPLEDMAAFDRALLDGKLLGAPAREELWKSDPSLGYMALGQWVFAAPLGGCEDRVQIVERRGGIGKYQIRNIILPSQDAVLILATDREDFDFGEIWAGSGAMYETLTAFACGTSE